MSAEEERSGNGGITCVMDALKGKSNDHYNHIDSLPDGLKIDFAIVGEPTSLRAAIAERGLLVIDATSHGVSGHAAREEGVNAIYKAIADIEKLKNFHFHSPFCWFVRWGGEKKSSIKYINRAGKETSNCGIFPTADTPARAERDANGLAYADRITVHPHKSADIPTDHPIFCAVC